MSTTDFEHASKQVNNLNTKPSNEDLLEIYGLYKQATVGDMPEGTKKPGMLDFKGKKKHEAWESLRGTSKVTAQGRYVRKVKSLFTAQGIEYPQ